MSRFINTELKSDYNSSDSELDSQKIVSKFDAELIAKLESGSDNDFWIKHYWLQMTTKWFSKIITNKNGSHKWLQIGQF